MLLGAVIGYNLGGPLGIIVGAICGILAGMGIGSALAPPSEGNKLGAGGRLALAGVTSGIAVALFFGFCILPLNWWNGLWSSGSKTSGGTNSSTYNAESYSEADRALRAAGRIPATFRRVTRRSFSDQFRTCPTRWNATNSMPRVRWTGPAITPAASTKATQRSCRRAKHVASTTRIWRTSHRKLAIRALAADDVRRAS